MSIIIKYETSDGELFEDKAEAVAYEKELQRPERKFLEWCRYNLANGAAVAEAILKEWYPPKRRGS